MGEHVSSAQEAELSSRPLYAGYKELEVLVFLLRCEQGHIDVSESMSGRRLEPRARHRLDGTGPQEHPLGVEVPGAHGWIQPHVPLRR